MLKMVRESEEKKEKKPQNPTKSIIKLHLVLLVDKSRLVEVSMYFCVINVYMNMSFSS